MARADYGEAERKRPGVDERPALPAGPPVTGPMALWIQRLQVQLWAAFSRYGFATNTLSLMEDQDKIRMRFTGVAR